MSVVVFIVVVVVGMGRWWWYFRLDVRICVSVGLFFGMNVVPNASIVEGKESIIITRNK